MANSVPTGDQTKKAKFDAQTYLLSYYTDICDIVSNVKYDYVYCLNTDAVSYHNSFASAISSLTDRGGLNKFTELKTYQYDSLIPNISLFRVEYGSDKNITHQKEFVFDKDTKYTVNNMTSPIIRNNCGIKSINWNLAGTNPVTAEKQIEVQIQFYFDSLNSFSGGSYDSMVEAWGTASDLSTDDFKFCDTDDGNGGGTTKNYWSLIFHPQQKNNKNKYDTFNYRIKAIVGWHDIEPNIRESLKLSEAQEDINRLTYAFFLNLNKHEFTLNEDGSLVLSANYIGSFENTTFNYNFNILGNLKEELDKLKKLSLRDIARSITDINAEVDILNDVNLLSTTVASDANSDFLSLSPTTQASDLVKRFNFQESVLNSTPEQLAAQQNLLKAMSNEETRQQLIQCDITNQEVIKLINNITDSKTPEKEAEYLQNVVDYSKNVINTATFFTKNKFYSKFINKLLEQNSNNTRYYSVTVDTLTITTWQNWYNGSANYKPLFINDSQTQNTALQTELDNVKKQVDDTLNEVLSKQDVSAITKDNEINSDDQQVSKIVFTTYANIIDTAYNVIKDELTNSGRTDLINELNRQKIILCNISDENKTFNYNITNGSNHRTSLRNIAFAPIEINLLKTFLIEKIVKPQKDTYPLYSFLKDTLSELVVSAMNSFDSSNDEVDKYASFSLASDIFTLGDDGKNQEPLQQFAEPNSSIVYTNNLYDKKQAMKSFYVNYPNLKTHKNYYSYYMIYDKNIKDYTPTNDPIKDADQGIYWYTYGQDYGLIKSINFSRMDTPYLKEAKSVGLETFYLGQFRDRYNAEITMIGNNIYYPGMLLHLIPSVEMSQPPSPTKPNFSQISGIGGYYMVIKVQSSISEDGYETKLSTIWQFDGSEKPSSIDENDKCKALLKEAGLISDNPSIESNALQLMTSLNTFASASIAAENELSASNAAREQAATEAVRNTTNIVPVLSAFNMIRNIF